MGELLPRSAAAFLDLFLLAAGFVAAMVWAVGRWGSGAQMTGLPAFGFFAGVVLVSVLYYWLFELLFGATPGKLIFDLQVRSKSGERAGPGPLLARTLLRVVDGIFLYLVGLLVAAFSKLRQRVGDHMAGTVVVHRPWNIALRGLVTLLWLFVIAFFCWRAYTGFRDLKMPARSSITTPVELSPSSTPSSGAAATTTAGAAEAPPSTLVLTSGNLKIDFSWVQSKDGPVRPPAPYKPEDDVIAQWRLTGFTTDPQGRIDVGLNVVPLGPDGLPLEKPWSDNYRQTIQSEGPIKGYYKLPLRPWYPSGTYRLALKVHDAVKNTDAEFTPTWVVAAGPPPAPSTTLEIRNFRFSTSEKGTPLDPPVYEAGQPVHTSFEVAGMQYRDDRSDVRIAYKLISPKGEVLIDKPEWMVLDREFVYHPPVIFLPITGSISLPSQVDKGTYTEKYVLQDNIAHATATFEAKFQVR